MRKPALALILVLVTVVLFRWLGPEELDLEWLKSRLRDIAAFRDARPILLALLFFAAYVAVTALSLPLAVWMTLAAGALFGFGWGVIIVSFAASIGATLAFLVARLFLGDWVQARFGDRMKSVNEGMARDGQYYLATLRLIPVVPFFLVNLLMALTPIRTGTFYAVSQIGMLPATVIYVNAGTQLARLDGISGILSPAMLLSLALLGIFPWIAKSGLAWFQRRRVYAGWSRPRRFDRNLVVIGAGAAGLVSAYIGAAAKAKVTLVEQDKMGGDCLNYGCVPSKALIRAAKVAHQIRHADCYGLKPSDPEPSFRDVFDRISRVIAGVAPHDSVARYEGLGVGVLQGHARIADPWTVETTDASGTVRSLTTRAIIIATGAEPFVPPLPGLDSVGYLTSDTLWGAFSNRDRPPRRLVVLGGGPVGTELSQAFARLGSLVTQIEMAPRLLIREDEEVSDHVRRVLEREGVSVLAGHRAVACGVTNDEKWIEVEAEGTIQRVPFDDLIVAVGRAPRLKGYGLEELSIPTDRVIPTNDYLETRFPNIYAVGDVAGPFQFTHTAAHQAWYASVNALFGVVRRLRADYRVIPWVTFTDPEVARVGLNEADARAKGVPYELARYDISDLDRAIADGTAEGFVKVLTVPGRDRILGVTIVGPHAGDLLAEFVLAMKHGLGLGKILGTIHSYPTLAEANKFAAGEWRKAHVSERALKVLLAFHAWRRGRA